jgi:hypothetical protein
MMNTVAYETASSSSPPLSKIPGSGQPRILPCKGSLYNLGSRIGLRLPTPYLPGSLTTIKPWSTTNPPMVRALGILAQVSK